MASTGLDFIHYQEQPDDIYCQTYAILRLSETPSAKYNAMPWEEKKRHVDVNREAFDWLFHVRRRRSVIADLPRGTDIPRLVTMEINLAFEFVTTYDGLSGRDLLFEDLQNTGFFRQLYTDIHNKPPMSHAHFLKYFIPINSKYHGHKTFTISTSSADCTLRNKNPNAPQNNSTRGNQQYEQSNDEDIQIFNRQLKRLNMNGFVTIAYRSNPMKYRHLMVLKNGVILNSHSNNALRSDPDVPIVNEIFRNIESSTGRSGPQYITGYGFFTTDLIRTRFLPLPQNSRDPASIFEHEQIDLIADDSDDEKNVIVKKQKTGKGKIRNCIRKYKQRK